MRFYLQTLESTTEDQIVVYITKSGISTINSNLNKIGGNLSNKENSEFYGVNATVLVQRGQTTIIGGTITTSAEGSNAVCVTNEGTMIISGNKITSNGSVLPRGLHSSYGGTITLTNFEISTTVGSCATFATDRREEKVSCTEYSLSKEGAESKIIYSTSEMSINKSK